MKQAMPGESRAVAIKEEVVMKFALAISSLRAKRSAISTSHPSLDETMPNT